jgi:hypothetical protein
MGCKISKITTNDNLTSTTNPTTKRNQVATFNQQQTQKHRLDKKPNELFSKKSQPGVQVLRFKKKEVMFPVSPGS